jgi:hypothetical protein
MTVTRKADTVYFTLRELGAILLLAVLAAVTGAVVPSYFFPEARIADFVYGVLGLPGPGAGVLVFGGVLCFWLLIGKLLLKKPGTAVALAAAIIALDLLFGSQVILIQTLDVLLLVALIIEAVFLVPVDQKPVKNFLPVCLAGLGVVTLALAILGQARQGENDLAVTQFPVIYCLIAVMGLIFAVVCYQFPVKCLVAAGIANMYYMLHFWLFWGTGFAARFPRDWATIPVLLLVALLGGVIFASAAYAIDLLLLRYGREDTVTA